MEWYDKFLDELTLYRPETPDSTALITRAVERGWQGNLWHCSLTESLLAVPNVFSLACERRRPARDSLWEIALRDMGVYRSLFNIRIDDPVLTDFRHDSDMARTPGARRLTALARSLAGAADPGEMLDLLTAHYERFGLGALGMGEIFRVAGQGEELRFTPVEHRRPVHLSDLVGYETQKELLLENTLSFLAGRRANNVLLYGDAGTGKSTSIQAIAGDFADRGLRLIELYKHQFALIPDILDRIKGRNYRFLLFLDDLSFEENEVEYKHLKAVMEGGAEAAPENVLIYATSNRRHLIRETWNDRADMQHDGDIHRSDTVEEKLSLAGRFGLQIYYPNPSFEEYHHIVRALAERSGTLSAYTDAQLRSLAAAWQVRRGSRSGRTAQQFIYDLMSRTRDAEPEQEDSPHADP